MHKRYALWFHRMIAPAALVLVAPVILAQAPPAPAPASAPASTAAPAASEGAAAPLAPAPVAPAVDEASSYSIGLVLGSQLRSSGLEESLLLEAVMRGFKEGLGGKVLDPQDKDRAMQLMRTGRDAAAARNRATARDFLAKNSTVPGITATASGLQYQIFDAGDAKKASPTLTDRVTVNYRGRLIDGTEFDNSDKHAQAATFTLNGILKGWREAIQLMKPGAKWRLFVPPELGYDLNGPPGIPPGSLLIFDVELLKVEPPAVMSPQGPKDHKGAVPATPRKPAPAKPPGAPAAAP